MTAVDVPHHSARLLVSCADRPGIVSAVSGFLFEEGANIVSSNQWSSDPTGGSFFLRLEFVLADFEARQAGFAERFAGAVAERFAMDWELRPYGHPRRLAILVSRYDHCLDDLLARRRHGELAADITQVISNHPDLESHATEAGVPFHHVPVEPGRKPQAEARMPELLRPDTELVVLARYMQILPGARRGADHRAGRDARRPPPGRRRARTHRPRRRADHVLARAVAAHLDDRVIVDGARTIVF